MPVIIAVIFILLLKIQGPLLPLKTPASCDILGAC